MDKSADKATRPQSKAPSLLRRCACGQKAHSGGGCSSCRNKRRLSRSGVAGASLDAATKARVLAVLREPGEPLEPGIRKTMERALSAPLGDVRIHDGAAAAKTAAEVEASAYAVGRHVVFAEGRYQPRSAAGRALLAHELTHVLQQRGQDSSDIDDIVIGPDTDRFEREAREVSAAVAKGRRAPSVEEMGVAGSAPAVLQREKRVCGPDVTAQIQRVWFQIQSDFNGSKWSDDDKEEACLRLIAPYPHFKENINAFDTLPLYYTGAANWLLAPEMIAVPCGTPTPDLSGRYSQKSVEARDMCSTSVAAYNKCWLSGTVNYGTYGIMINLCNKKYPTSEPINSVFKKWADKFSDFMGGKFAYQGFNLQYGENLIRAYKAHGGTMQEPNIEEPISWYRAAFNGGPAGRPLTEGNRPSCPVLKTDCPVNRSVVNWDYVWEPVQTRQAEGGSRWPHLNVGAFLRNRARWIGPRAGGSRRRQ